MADESAAQESPLPDDELASFAGRLKSLPHDDAQWVDRLLRECLRARAAESELARRAASASGELDELQHDIAQTVLDTAEWLRTLWHVGYMGAGRFPAAPRSEFPAIEVEDILKSALLQRIRKGMRPLPFPPPARHGVPWHEVVESDEKFMVAASLVADDGPVVAAVIEGCPDWQISEEISKGSAYVVQHQGKGPRYQLDIGDAGCSLKRLPPLWSRRIAMQVRGGVSSYMLEWPRPDGGISKVPLRAASWERAESEASHWVALKHPEMYGQILFERVDPA